MSPTRLAYAALGTTLVLWASAFVAIRHLGEDFGPGALSLGRQGVAAIALGAVVLIRGFTMPRLRDWPALVVIGVLWFAIYHIALNEAERRVDAGTASMLLQVSPIIITVLAILFLGERARTGVFVGLLVAFAGVTLIGFATSDGGNRDLVGVLLCLVACVTYSTSVILQKPLLIRMTPLDVTFISCLIGTLVATPFAPELVRQAERAPVSSLWWVVYLGMLPTALAFTTWAFALSHLDASTLGISTYLVPPVTVFIAWVALSEAPPKLAYVGGVLCLLGVWWARRQPSAARLEPTAEGVEVAR